MNFGGSDTPPPQYGQSPHFYILFFETFLKGIILNLRDVLYILNGISGIYLGNIQKATVPSKVLVATVIVHHSHELLREVLSQVGWL